MKTYLVLSEPVYLERDEFLQLRIADVRFQAPPYHRCKFLLSTGYGGQRWHAVERQYQFGEPIYFANPIVVRVRCGT